MAVRFAAVDSGKFATKLAWADPKLETYNTCSFRTKMGLGNFADDAIEDGTFVVEIDGNVYKIGNGAPKEAVLETSKKSDIHKICTLLALALIANPSGDEFKVAIGAPVAEWAVVDKRNEYRDYILPEGDITVKYKTSKSDDIHVKTFSVVKKYVYAESAGALYLDMLRNKDTAAIVDLGNLNVNCTYWSNFVLDETYSATGELGGQILVRKLADELSSAFTRVDERLVSNILKRAPEDRFLKPVKVTAGSEEVEARSKQIIKEFLYNHVKEIQRKCDSLHWSLDYMELTFIGGTSALLQNEIREVFGENVFIPENPDMANVIGFLRRLIAKEADVVLPYKKDKKAA